MPTKTIDIFGNRKLDARPDRLDLRDRPYTPPVATLPPFYPRDADIASWLPQYVEQNLILNQETEGSCTGFGLACVIHYLLWRQNNMQPITLVSTRMLYHLARFYDEWPGEDYDGSSCRGALKAWHHHGACSAGMWPYRNLAGEVAFVRPNKGWERDAIQRRLGVYYRIDPRSVVDMQAAIFEVGAVYVSAYVHDGWNVRADATVAGQVSLPVIGRPETPENLGGHAFALVGYNPTGFVVQNSWGPSWGCQGFAILPYDEWVHRGLDAWVCALGVPGDGAGSSSVLVRGPRPRVPAGYPSRAALGRQSLVANSPVAPWTLEKACRHSIVMGNEGRPLNYILTHENGADSVQQLVAVAPRGWLNGQPPAARRIMLYAHGGLNSEEESLNRVKVLAPYFEANGIYPLFLTWRTGLVETLGHILEDEVARLLRPQGGVRDWLTGLKEHVSEARDRALEVAAGAIAKPIWSQMKQNAAASVEAGRSTALVADHLADLASGVEGLEIHLVGHSAGSILLGHFLDAAKTRGLTVRSCSLYAPACTIDFANDHYRPAVAGGVMAKEDLHVHVLSDAREREDTVMGTYGKSLLYLVSRALETTHKTPLLGLANVFFTTAQPVEAWNDAKPIQAALTNWRTWWQGQANNLHVVDTREVSTGPQGPWIPAAHGCFDNHADTITATLTRILSANPSHAIRSLDY